jgi:hypothetical protein
VTAIEGERCRRAPLLEKPPDSYLDLVLDVPFTRVDLNERGAPRLGAPHFGLSYFFNLKNA